MYMWNVAVYKDLNLVTVSAVKECDYRSVALDRLQWYVQYLRTYTGSAF